MSGCVASNCSINRCISTASLPCTGTGKYRSISVAARAWPTDSASAAVKASVAAKAGTRRMTELLALLDAGKHETRDETTLEQHEHQQQRCRDQERSGGDHAPFRPRLGARGERRQPH